MFQKICPKDSLFNCDLYVHKKQTSCWAAKPCLKELIERVIHEKELKMTIKQVEKMYRNDLLRRRTRECKDPQTKIVSTCHPKLNAILSTLKNNFQLFSNNPALLKIFKQKLTLTYLKNNQKTIFQINNFIPTYYLVEKTNFVRK